MQIQQKSRKQYKKELKSVYVLRRLSMSSIPLILHSQGMMEHDEKETILLLIGEMKWNYSLIANSYLDFSILSSTFDSSADFKPKKKTQINPIPIRKISPKKTNSKREDDDQKFLITSNKTAKRQKIIGIERRPNQRVLLINQSTAHKKKKKRKLDYTSGRRNEKRLLWERERKKEVGSS